MDRTFHRLSPVKPRQLDDITGMQAGPLGEIRRRKPGHPAFVSGGIGARGHQGRTGGLPEQTHQHMAVCNPWGGRLHTSVSSCGNIPSCGRWRATLEGGLHSGFAAKCGAGRRALNGYVAVLLEEIDSCSYAHHCRYAEQLTAQCFECVLGFHMGGCNRIGWGAECPT
jgi:hypothetical protein